MIDLSLILDPAPVSNFQRITAWRLRFRQRFGIFPNPNFHTVRPCKICGRPVWIIPHDFVLHGAKCINCKLEKSYAKNHPE